MIRKLLLVALQITLLTTFGCAQDKVESEAQDPPADNQNRLQHSNSPYLLQHADNPVNWYPWGEEAFEKAEEEDKPIFLSVGYSTCYWCHVMERKVFMNEEIASKMNEYFVNIKVDREQRPDVDRVYMNAVRAMTGGGGWPMSVFLTPDLKPFFGATYIPPYGHETEDGRKSTGFNQLTDRMNSVWQNQRQQVIKQAEKVTQHIKETASPDLEPEKISSSVLQTAYSSISGRYDSDYGGFGSAPKFPRPSNLDFLLRYHQDSGNEKALDMVAFTLQKMASGGMYDHIGEGFHRYSTDEQWRVPHFEKMLYDQAQLTNTYLKAYQITNSEQYANVANNVLEFVDRKFYNPEGGFYSALNAESHPPENPEAQEEEGAFYVWTKSQIDEALPQQQANVFNYVYGVEEDGNALQDPHDVFTGKNILYKEYDASEAAQEFDMSREKVNKLLEEAKQTLFEIRSERPKPFLDDKIVLSWNGLMISAYANAYNVLGDEQYKEHAVESVQFLMDKLYNSDTGKFKRTYRDGEAEFTANMEDYAYLVKGLLDLYEATENEQLLDYATEFTDTQIDLFYDSENGAFYDTRMEDKYLLIRTKESYDGARPSGNSVAIKNLVRLADLTGNSEYEEKATESIRYFGPLLNQRPSGMPKMLQGLSISLE
jgi:uncharacterized protein YyaL (SSP411 family)